MDSRALNDTSESEGVGAGESGQDEESGVSVIEEEFSINYDERMPVPNDERTAPQISHAVAVSTQHALSLSTGTPAATKIESKATKSKIKSKARRRREAKLTKRKLRKMLRALKAQIREEALGR